MPPFPCGSPGNRAQPRRHRRTAQRSRSCAATRPGPELRGRCQHRAPHRSTGRGRRTLTGRRDRRRPGFAHVGARRNRRRSHRGRDRPWRGAGVTRHHGGTAEREGGGSRRNVPRLGRTAGRGVAGPARLGTGSQLALQRRHANRVRPARRRAADRAHAGDGPEGSRRTVLRCTAHAGEPQRQRELGRRGHDDRAGHA